MVPAGLSSLSLLWHAAGGILGVCGANDRSCMAEPLLLSDELTIDLGSVRIVDGLSFRLEAGRTLGVVGESGCGKSMTALAVMGLVPSPSRLAGRLQFEGRDLLAMPEDVRRGLRGRRMAMIFQEPMTALNPVVPVGVQIGEMLVVHEGFSPGAAERRAVALLDRVGIAAPDQRARAYPHELSGGMRKRAALIRTLVYDPPMILMDEPFAAVDAQTRIQLQEDLLRLWSFKRKTIIFVTHDITEAIALGDRALVLTQRPARIAAEHPISIPRPRNVKDIFTAPGFGSIYERIRADVQ